MIQIIRLPIIFSLILAVAAVALVSCGGSANSDITDSPPNAAESDNTPANNTDLAALEANLASEPDNIKAVYNISISTPEEELIAGQVTIAQRPPSDLRLEFTGSLDLEGLAGPLDLDVVVDPLTNGQEDDAQTLAFEEVHILFITTAESDHICIPFGFLVIGGTCLKLPEEDRILGEDDLGDIFGQGKGSFIWSLDAITQDAELNLSQTGNETIAGLNATCHVGDIALPEGDLLGDLDLLGDIDLPQADFFGDISSDVAALSFCFSDNGLLLRVEALLDEAKISLEIVSIDEATDSDFECCPYPISDGSDLFGDFDLPQDDFFGDFDMQDDCMRAAVGNERFEELNEGDGLPTVDEEEIYASCFFGDFGMPQDGGDAGDFFEY